MLRRIRRWHSTSPKIGDLVHVSHNFRPFIGVVISEPNPDTAYYSSIDATAQIKTHFKRDINLSSTGWAYLPNIQKQATGYVEIGIHPGVKDALNLVGIPSHVTSHILGFQRSIEAAVLGNTKDPKNISNDFLGNGESIYLKDAVNLFLHLSSDCIPTPGQLFTAAAVMAEGIMVKKCFPVVCSTNPEYSIRSLNDFTFLKNLVPQFLVPLSPLEIFICKSRAVIESYRSGYLKVTRVNKVVEFNDEERMIIRFMKESLCVSKDCSQIESRLTFHVLRRLSPFFARNPTNADTISFMRQIGVFSVNEDVSLYQSTPKGRLENLELISKKGDIDVREAQGIANHMIEQGLVSGSRDPLERLRVDVPETVFAIDDPTAHEIDDGISFEENHQGTWIHVHIADPTAYMTPTSRLAVLAESRGTSIYLPHRQFPLMPSDLSDNLFNLGVSPLALTFSALLNEGEILDYKIRPTILKDLRKFSYDSVDTILDWSRSFETNTPVWGQVQKSRSLLPPDKTLSLNDIKSLRSLHQLVLCHQGKRLKNGALIPDQLSMSIRVEEAPLLLSPHQSKFSFPEKYMSQKSTIVINPYNSSHRAPSHTLVSESMIIAGRIAAKFCQDRKIPAAYRCQLSPSENMSYLNHDQKYIQAAEGAMASAREHTDSNSGITEYAVFKGLLKYMPAAYMSSTPNSHASMGISSSSNFGGYLKVTSPLRRYQDMIAHFQIQASLLDQPFAFNAQEIESKTKKLDLIHGLEKSLSKRSQRFWSLEYLKRQCHSPTDDLVAQAMPTYKPAFDYNDNLNQPVYDAITEYTIKLGRTDCFVVLPQLGGLRGRCTVYRDAEMQPMISVVVEKVHPDSGQVSFRQIV